MLSRTKVFVARFAVRIVHIPGHSPPEFRAGGERQREYVNKRCSSDFRTYGLLAKQYTYTGPYKMSIPCYDGEALRTTPWLSLCNLWVRIDAQASCRLECGANSLCGAGTVFDRERARAAQPGA